MTYVNVMLFLVLASAVSTFAYYLKRHDHLRTLMLFVNEFATFFLGWVIVNLWFELSAPIVLALVLSALFATVVTAIRIKKLRQRETEAKQSAEIKAQK